MVIDDTNRSTSGNYVRLVAGFTKKKPGSKEPGLRYWPREADTITFQEGLLNSRATGGGGCATRMLSVQTLWSALAPCSNHPRRMSVMRRSRAGSVPYPE